MSIDQIKLETPTERNLYFNKQVDQASIGKLTEQIIEINNHDRKLEKLYDIYDIQYTPNPINIYIDSYGGRVYQCFGLLSVIDCSVTPIHTYVTGAAMSAGFLMLICGHKRFAYALSTPLYHQASKSFYGTAKDMEEDFMEIKRLQTKMEDIVMKRTKITREKLTEIYEKKTDWYMSATQALRLGVVDEIIKNQITQRK